MVYVLRVYYPYMVTETILLGAAYLGVAFAVVALARPTG